MTSASLWAAVPHYVAAVPNPKAALALLRRLEGFTGIAVEASELEEAPAASRTRSTGRRRQPRDQGARRAARVRAGRRRATARSPERRPVGRHRSRASSSASCASAAGATSSLRRSATPQTPGRSAGSRTRSRSRATGGARSPGLDPGGDLEHGALDPLGVVGLGGRPRPSRRRARTSRLPPSASISHASRAAEPVERELHVAAEPRA